MKVREFVMNIKQLSSLEEILNTQSRTVIQVRSRYGNVLIKDYPHLRYTLWLISRANGYNKKQSNENVDWIVKQDFKVEDEVIYIDDFGGISIAMKKMSIDQVQQIQDWDYYFTWSKDYD